MKTIRWLLIAVAALVLLGAVFIYSGMFNVAADDPHWSMTSRLIEATREHSIDAQSRSVLTSPSLEDPDLIAMGDRCEPDPLEDRIVWRRFRTARDE